MENKTEEKKGLVLDKWVTGATAGLLLLIFLSFFTEIFKKSARIPSVDLRKHGR